MTPQPSKQLKKTFSCCLIWKETEGYLVLPLQYRISVCCLFYMLRLASAASWTNQPCRHHRRQPARKSLAALRCTHDTEFSEETTTQLQHLPTSNTTVNNRSRFDPNLGFLDDYLFTLNCNAFASCHRPCSHWTATPQNPS